METAANMAHATDAIRRAMRSVVTSRSEGWPLVGATPVIAQETALSMRNATPTVPAAPTNQMARRE